MSHAYDDSPGLPALFERQARASEAHGSHLYAGLCRRAAQDVAAGGLLAGLLAPWAAARAGDMLPLRVLGAAHRLVLERRAPRLAVWFPSVGGTAPTDDATAEDCFADWLSCLAEHRDELPGLLERTPQTNDPGRAAALAGVLLLVTDAWHLPVRMHELGTSAGLNLRADRARLTWPGGATGPPGSPLLLEHCWLGAPLPPPGEPRVVERVGCDLDPVDPTSTEGRLLLTSFVWPDQPERLARLRAGLALADQVPASVVRRDLVQHLSELRPADGSVLVVWHSSTWMYLDERQRAQAEDAFGRLAALATPAAPVVHAAREYLDDRLDTGFAVALRWWPAPEPVARQGFSAGVQVSYADTPAHGLPVTWHTPRVVGADAVAR